MAIGNMTVGNMAVGNTAVLSTAVENAPLPEWERGCSAGLTKARLYWVPDEVDEPPVLAPPPADPPAVEPPGTVVVAPLLSFIELPEVPP